jgi:hypothetical protein
MSETAAAAQIGKVWIGGPGSIAPKSPTPFAAGLLPLVSLTSTCRSAVGAKLKRTTRAPDGIEGLCIKSRILPRAGHAEHQE